MSFQPRLWHQQVLTADASRPKLVLVHGGPGACGDLAPLARDISKSVPTLEPWQSANSVSGQIEELAQQIRQSTDQPVTLAGHSWGAWLVWMTAARYPELCNKLVLIGSGPFAKQYRQQITRTREQRWSLEDFQQQQKLMQQWPKANAQQIADIFQQFAAIYDRCDGYQLIEHSAAKLSPQPQHISSVWPEADAMRADGSLIAQAKNINCPISVIHGDYDPHPLAGITEVFDAQKITYSATLLAHCGHSPWREQLARDHFLQQLISEVMTP